MANMGQTWEAPETCPVCGHNHLLITRLSCPACGSALEGAFESRAASAGSRPGESLRRSGPLAATPGSAVQGEARFGRLARLSDQQLEFVEVFLRCRGVIKNVEDMLGISYPTVRGRLNDVLETLGLASDDDSAANQRRLRRKILTDLSAQRISAEEALELLASAPEPDEPDSEDDDEQ